MAHETGAVLIERRVGSLRREIEWHPILADERRFLERSNLEARAIGQKQVPGIVSAGDSRRDEQRGQYGKANTYSGHGFPPSVARDPRAARDVQAACRASGCNAGIGRMKCQGTFSSGFRAECALKESL